MLYIPLIAESNLMDLLELAKQFGAPVAIMVFFIWRDYKREQDLTVRLRDLEEYQKTTLSSIVKESTQAITRNNQLFEEIRELLKDAKRN